MILLAGVICFCLTVLVGYLIVRQDIERENWVKERRELLTRLQHPEIVPQGEAPTIPDSDFMTAPEPDDIDLVGRAVTSGQD